MNGCGTDFWALSFKGSSASRWLSGAAEHGDIDVSTLDELIEVKKSFSAWSGKKAQINKFVNSSMDDFLNPYSKKVILYIDEPLSVAQKATITNYIPSNVTVVNSLTELQTVLKLWG